MKKSLPVFLVVMFLFLVRLGAFEGIASGPRGMIVPLPEAAPALPEGNPAALLVVELSLDDGFHIYTTTQPKVSGGYPTKLRVTLPDGWTAGEFIDVSRPEMVPFMGNTLEELTGEILFAAPLFGTADDLGALAETITGKIDALCCDDNNCAPLRGEISFEFDAERDIASCLAALNKETAAPNEENTAPKEDSLQRPDVSPQGKSASAAEAERAGFGRNLLYDLLLAFFGGMILNIMPCVLPVIGLKIIGFFEQAGHSRSRAFTLNAWYALGILLVFATLALMSVGLSYLFTYGLFQIIMGGIVFVMALNLMGVWEIPLPAVLGGKRSSELARREGAFGAIFKGVITTLLAIPCGAPLLSPVLVWTDSMIQQGRTAMALTVYLVIGLGMAFPYLVIGAFPELLRFLPKPGAWTERFRNMMGFVLLGAVIWILFSMPIELILSTLALLFALWFVCWYLWHPDEYGLFHVNVRKVITALVILAATILLSFTISLPAKEGVSPELSRYTLENAVRRKLRRWAIRASRAGELEQNDWILFSRERLDQELADKKVVLVDFTADWCMNCKVLESTVLRHPRVEQIIAEKKIVTMTADWTSRDASQDGRQVGELLRQYGGEQVPVVMIFPGGGEPPRILRGLFTVDTLCQTLSEL
ncbi:MAG: thioredoxin family protein [Thermoguttaceae bacterium]|nr:thioredoxin family protein [Thermoguttaceae bacterium]